MEPIFFVMAIVGCGDAGIACEPARVERARYDSAAACQRAMPAALVRNSDIDAPVITAECRASATRVAVNTRTRG